MVRKHSALNVKHGAKGAMIRAINTRNTEKKLTSCTMNEQENIRKTMIFTWFVTKAQDGISEDKMKTDKKFEAGRTSGMQYALKIAREKGCDELEKQIRFRGVLEVPVEVDVYKISAEITQWLDEMTQNLQGLLVPTACYVLYDKFGFTPEQIREYLKIYNDLTYQTLVLTEDGERKYLDIAEAAEMLNEECGTHFNIADIKKVSEIERVEQFARGEYVEKPGRKL
jgi:hypothetical protein